MCQLLDIKYKIIENEQAEIPVVKWKELYVKDEYDTDNIIDEHIGRTTP